MSSTPDKFVVAVGRVSVFIGYACAILLFACVTLSATEVILRYVFDYPTVWSFEVVMGMCATVWVLSVGFVTQQKRHIAITMLELVVSKRTWNFLLLVQMLIAVFATSMLLWAVYDPVISSLTYIERSGSAFNPPLPAYLKSVLFIGCILYLFQLCANIIIWFKNPHPPKN